MNFKRIVIPAIAVLLTLIAVQQYRHAQGIKSAISRFENAIIEPVGDIGTTHRLSILPLMDFHTDDPRLATEVGLSYLIDTDTNRILFDVGQNSGGEAPSPLQRNMAVLGVELATRYRIHFPQPP